MCYTKEGSAVWLSFRVPVLSHPVTLVPSCPSRLLAFLPGLSSRCCSFPPSERLGSPRLTSVTSVTLDFHPHARCSSETHTQVHPRTPVRLALFSPKSCFPHHWLIHVITPAFLSIILMMRSLTACCLPLCTAHFSDFHSKTPQRIVCTWHPRVLHLHSLLHHIQGGSRPPTPQKVKAFWHICWGFPSAPRAAPTSSF